MRLVDEQESFCTTHLHASPPVPRRQCRLVTRASAWPQAKDNGAPAKVDPRLAKRHGLPLFLVQLLLTVGLGAALFFAISKCVGHFGPCFLTRLNLACLQLPPPLAIHVLLNGATAGLMVRACIVLQVRRYDGNFAEAGEVHHRFVGEGSEAAGVHREAHRGLNDRRIVTCCRHAAIAVHVQVVIRCAIPFQFARPCISP